MVRVTCLSPTISYSYALPLLLFETLIFKTFDQQLDLPLVATSSTKHAKQTNKNN
jgi:hypothetical protein